MSRRLRVYIASAISRGNLCENIDRATEAARELIKLGYAVLCPQLSCYMNANASNPEPSIGAGFDHQTWIENDLPWVECADVVLRLPGESSGADQECEHARLHGIPVCYSVGQLDCAVRWKPFDDALHRSMNGEAKRCEKSGDSFCGILSKDQLNDISVDHCFQHKGDSRFHAILSEMGQLSNNKQKDYGTNTDPYANVRGAEKWKVPGWIGAMIRATDKIQRLQAFVENGSLANEGVEDSLLDLANYAVIALILFREKSGK